MESQNGRVKLNVGGKIFETTAGMFAIAGQNSFFGALFDENRNLQNDNSNEYFINRDPDCFGVLLNLLRTGELCIPFHIPEKLLYKEAMFYGLLDHVRSAKWGPFDGNRLHLSHSIRCQAAAIGSVIRAGPDGGCCVAHDSIVHVYNWMLEEHRPINLDYQKVNDIGWINEDTIVVSTSERQGDAGGGMGLFGSTTGELRHRFLVTHGDQLKGYTAGALCFGSDDKIFSTCKGDENGIYVWDQVTGKHIDFYHDSLGWPLANAHRLQWLNGINCLMVASLFHNDEKDYSQIILWDVRVKEPVWSRSNLCNLRCDDYSMTTTVRDAIVVEEANSICVVNEYGDLRLLDLRRPAENVRWVNESSIYVRNKLSNVRLAWHKGQLFLLKDGSISVFCGPDWKLTSRLWRPNRGPISDISVGGDRLFALRKEENVFDIWETPRPPIF